METRLSFLKVSFFLISLFIAWVPNSYAQAEDYECPGNILRNAHFDSPTSPWRILNRTTTAFLTGAYGDCYTSGNLAVLGTHSAVVPTAIEQPVLLKKDRFYTFSAPVMAVRGELFPAILQVWVTTADSSVTYASLLDESYLPESAQLVGTHFLSSYNPCFIFSKTWKALGNYSRLIVLVKPFLSNRAAEVRIDNLCLIPLEAEPTVCDSLAVDFSYVSSGLAVHFQPQVTLGEKGTIARVKWSFYDAVSGLADSSSLLNPDYQFPNFGWYSICLFVEASSGGKTCGRTICKQIWVERACPDLHADFSDSLAWKYQMYQFTDNTTFPSGTTASWLWNFGDGSISTKQNPVHYYESEGNYVVCLIVGGKQESGEIICDDTICKTIKVEVDSCSCDKLQVDYIYTLDTATETIQFTNLTVPFCATATSFRWVFGNGASSLLPNPTQTFAQGTYNVCLQVTSTLSNGLTCKRTHCKYITLHQTATATPPPSVKNPISGNELKVFPNPTFGELSVEQGNTVIPKVQVYNMLGKLVFETTQTSFNIANLPQGIYFLKANGITQRIVKR